MSDRHYRLLLQHLSLLFPSPSRMLRKSQVSARQGKNGGRRSGTSRATICRCPNLDNAANRTGPATLGHPCPENAVYTVACRFAAPAFAAIFDAVSCRLRIFQRAASYLFAAPGTVTRLPAGTSQALSATHTAKRGLPGSPACKGRQSRWITQTRTRQPAPSF